MQPERGIYKCDYMDRYIGEDPEEQWFLYRLWLRRQGLDTSKPFKPEYDQREGSKVFIQPTKDRK